MNIDKIGLNFDNSYSNLSNSLVSKTNPIPVKSPKLAIFNYELAKNLDLDFNKINESEISSLLSGNYLPKGSNYIAQAYAGHQFGYFTVLGDGRATLMGEHVTKKNKRYDIQLKGAGRTPYSRNGDGRATLPSMLREYLISEAMHGLGISTTRSLSVVSSGENVQREKNFNGGILTRIASSHIRVGTFQYLSMKGDQKTLNKLITYCLKRHYSKELINNNAAITLLKLVRNKQISLIVDWMRVGFIHGVMNTDNMSISGETIDYGPCAFMDSYDPKTVFSSIDHTGRYSYANQSLIAHWNISRFAETLIPFLDSSEKKAIEIGSEIIDEFESIFRNKWLKMMRGKIGFLGEQKKDNELIQCLLDWMYSNKADYTNTFIHLMNKNLIKDKIYNSDSFIQIKIKIDERRNKNNPANKKINNLYNPLFIPRNHIVEEALIMIQEDENYELLYKLLDILKNPYLTNENKERFQSPPNSLFAKEYQTFCGT